MVEVYEPTASQRNQTVMYTGPDEVSVQGEKNLLGQLVANLIENALRHTDEAAQISVAIAQTPNEIILSVTDDGPGIPKSEFDRVTQRL